MFGYTTCLAHLLPAERERYLATLGTGAAVDHRGTVFDGPLLEALLQAVKDPETGKPTLGEALFAWATFTGDASFTEVRFTDNAGFTWARFEGQSNFARASFIGSASFNNATFTARTNFFEAAFNEYAWFSYATFEEGASRIGPLACKESIDFIETTFRAPLEMSIAAYRVNFCGTRWEAATSLYLRYAIISMTGAVLRAPLFVTTYPVAFPKGWKRLNESPLRDCDMDSSNSDRRMFGLKPIVKVASLRGLNAEHLVLADVDLSECIFSGVFNLDRLRLEGNCHFLSTAGWPWTRRRTIVEEHYWRAGASRYPHPDWKSRPQERALTFGDEEQGEPPLTAGPLAVIYRQLRKSLEDSKNHPDAADFYYGEMEMRRHDRQRSRAERVLLGIYWVISGYGLRASRALLWLALTISLTVMLLMLFGMPNQPHVQHINGKIVDEQQIALTTRLPSTQGAAPKVWSEKFSWKRADRAVRTAVNSVVFRSTGQGMTVAGSYIEMASRMVEPILLALAILAVRGRIRR